jgi:hypothetical protein
MTVYVKDVFRNSGRFTLTLDEAMNKQKVTHTLTLSLLLLLLEVSLLVVLLVLLPLLSQLVLAYG